MPDNEYYDGYYNDEGVWVDNVKDDGEGMDEKPLEEGDQAADDYYGEDYGEYNAEE